MSQTSAAFFRFFVVYNSATLYTVQANSNIRVGKKKVTSIACCLSMPHGNVDVRLQCPNIAHRIFWRSTGVPAFLSGSGTSRMQ